MASGTSRLPLAGGEDGHGGVCYREISGGAISADRMRTDRDAVEDKALGGGEHIYTVSALAENLDVSRRTVLRRLNDLRGAGLVERKRPSEALALWWATDAGQETFPDGDLLKELTRRT